MTLTMICPSRGRPTAIAQLTESWRDTGAVAQLLVVADIDDPHLPAYEALGLKSPARLRVNTTDSGLAPILNRVAVAVSADPACTAVGFLGDDHRPRTPGWDQHLMEALATPGVAYGNDLFQSSKLPTAVVISSQIIRTLGYFVPPGMTHLYLDDYWRQLGTDIGSFHYLPDVIIEHMHPAAHKGQWDEGYLRVNSGDMWAADGQAYTQFIRNRWPADLAELREALRG